MMKYDLLPNEGIILQSTNVLHGGFMSSYTDELVLTNIHLIYVKRGIFGNVKDVQKMPLRAIKIVNDRVQVMWGQNPATQAEQLQLYFIDGSKETFEFQNNERSEIVRWANEISRIVTGDQSNLVYENIQQQNSFKKKAADMIKDVFGVADTVIPPQPAIHLSAQDRTYEKAEGSKIITKFCVNCGAPITGEKGQVAHCEYCDTDQEL